MGMIDIASRQSVWRGLDYYKENKVDSYRKIRQAEYEGVVKGSDNKKYNVLINIEHPRKSKCNCPHAKDKLIICKHIITLYFTIFPDEVDNFIKEIEESEKEYQFYEEEQEKKLIKYIKKMSKSELQQTVLELLYDAPDWVYNRFVRDIKLDIKNRTFIVRFLMDFGAIISKVMNTPICLFK